jgi:multiple sugar transport system permease protein
MEATSERRKRIRWGRISRQTLIYVLVIVVLVYALAPFAWLILSGLMPRWELLSFPPHWIPEDLTIDNFKYLFFEAPPPAPGQKVIEITKKPSEYIHGLKNSVVIAFSVTSLSLFFGSLAAYSLARIRWPGKQVYILALIAMRMIPGIGTYIPSYIIFSRLRLIDTTFLLVVLETAYLLPFTMFILYGVFQAIPMEIEDAAFIDGCSRLQTLYRIIWPLATPGLVAGGTFAFLGSWNSFFTPLVFAQNRAKTFPVVVSELVTNVDADYTAIAAGGVFACIAPVILALAFQRYIVQGLTTGALKG